MLVSSLDYHPHLGKIAIGRISQGTLNLHQKVLIADTTNSFNVESIMTFKGLTRTTTDKAIAGDIIALSGINNINIGQTITDPSDKTPLPTIKLSDPTLHLTIGPNTSPFAGKEGNFSTAKQLEARLSKELETNLSLKLEKLEDGHFKISGRGELHLSVLLESLRREGYEFEVGKPEVITKNIDGKTHEPVEEVNIIVPDQYVGVITQEIGKRFGKLIHMSPLQSGEVEFIYHLPTRNLIGLRSLLMTATKGTVVMSSQINGYEPLGTSLPTLRRGVLIAAETGPALAYGLQNAQGRGITFIDPGINVYEGMIIGQNSRDEDIEINVTKGKKLTNMRSKSSDGIIQLEPATIMSLEQSLDFLEKDELLEITPLSLRLRKKYLTDIERRRQRRPSPN
jgi:GTP-binding protein